MGRNSSKMGLAALIIALSGMLLVSGCDSFFQNNNVSADTDSRSVPVLPDIPKASDEFFAMDTIITLEAYGGEAQRGVEEAKAWIQEMEKLWSVTDSGSEIFRINHSQGKIVEISRETEELLAFALATAEETKGAFNPAMYPLIRAWGFTTREYRILEADELSCLLPHTDYSQIVLKNGTIAMPEAMEIDMGAVAKGYVGDQTAKIMRNHGVVSAILNLGGNVSLIGRSPEGFPWRVGIRSPYGEGNMGVLEAEDVHIITSGGYERYFVGEDGKIYWHILNPADGTPADSGLLSATIVGKNGAMCDSLSTAIFVMGREKAEDYWRSRKDFEMILVTSDNEIYVTEGLENSFSLNEASYGIPVYVMK